MDDNLLQLVKDAPKSICTINPSKEEVEIDIAGQQRTLPLRPLGDLYGKGTGLPSVDTKDETFLSLLMQIEEAIVEIYLDNPSLTDGQVSLVLEDLGMNPESPAGGDELKRAVQFRLRLTLSLNDYSRQDVRLGLRKIAKSIQRHTRDSGRRGYLEFIRQQFRR